MASVISHDSRLSRESAKTIKDVALKSASKYTNLSLIV